MTRGNLHAFLATIENNVGQVTVIPYAPPNDGYALNNVYFYISKTKYYN
nr:hypothetical protein [Neobacillus sp. 179.-C4.2 HS]